MYDLKNDLPIPTAATTNTRRRYPFGVMKVGEHFSVEREDERRVLQAARKHAERYSGWSFVAGRDAAGVLRIWRKS